MRNSRVLAFGKEMGRQSLERQVFHESHPQMCMPVDDYYHIRNLKEEKTNFISACLISFYCLLFTANQSEQQLLSTQLFQKWKYEIVLCLVVVCREKKSGATTTRGKLLFGYCVWGKARSTAKANAWT